MNGAKSNNPFKGLYPYEERDAKFFYGRRIEAETIFRLVQSNMLTVLFGKSGIGKTSLLNAGLFPKLFANKFLPVKLRLNYSPLSNPLLEQVKTGIQQQLKEHSVREVKKGAKDSAHSFTEKETLWEYFNRVEHVDELGQSIIPVVVLDQFEELFTIGKYHPDRADLVEQLYYIVENQIPDFFQEEDTEKGEDFPYSCTTLGVKLLLGLREDYLPHLNSLKRKIPSIDRVLYRVLHFNGKQAREVLEMSGRFVDEKTQKDILRQFYPEEIRIEENISDENLEVEPSLLSLLCYQMIENGVISLSGQEKNAIFVNFYEEELSKLPHSEELAEYIETRLLTESGFRTPVLLDTNHHLKNSLEEAVNKRFLRKVYYGEKEYIEIIHDVLIPVIKERRDRRIENERRKKEQQRYRQTVNKWIGVLGGFAIIVAFLAFFQWQRADKQFKEAVVQKNRAISNQLVAQSTMELSEDNMKAFRIAEAAYRTNTSQPSHSAMQVLMNAAYSTYQYPFYTLNLQHKKKVLSALLSPDQKRILTLSEDGYLTLCDWQGNKIPDFKRDIPLVRSAAFSKKGDKIIVTSKDNRTLIFDGRGNSLFEKIHKEYIFESNLSPDGLKVIARSDKIVKVMDLSGNELAILDKHIDYISSATFSPDSTMIITSSWDMSVKVWDLKGKVLMDRPYSNTVDNALFSDKGNYILTVDGKSAKLRDLKGTLIVDLDKHEENVKGVAMSPDESTIITWSGNTVNIWKINGASLLKRELPTGVVQGASYSPKGDTILTWTGNVAQLWDLQGNLLANLDKHTDLVSSASFSRDGNTVITSSWDYSARLWDLKTRFLVDLRKKGSFSGNTILSPDGTKILSWQGNDVQLSDLFGRQASIPKWTPMAFVLRASFTADGKKIIFSLNDNTSQLWDIEKNLPVNLDRIFAELGGITISPDGGILFMWSGKSVKLWDIKAKKMIAQFTKHSGDVLNGSFSPDGTKILTASNDRTAKLWDLQGNLLADLKKHTGDVVSAVFSPDGNKILTASSDKTAKLWDLKGNLLADLNKHTDAVLSAAFSADGKRMITISKDGTIKSWTTPEAIMDWLKTAPIPKLTEADKENLGIRDFKNE